MPKVPKYSEAELLYCFEMAVGERVAMARNFLKMEQVELARLARMSRSTLANLEAGRHQPKALEIARICLILKVEPEWVFFGRGKRAAHEKQFIMQMRGDDKL